MLNKVQSYIRQHHLLQPSSRYLVALSGGADSVCLLLVLRQLGYQIEAVHCNFQLRGEESRRDENFCVELCKRLSVTLHLTCFDTKAYANLHQVSIEMAARQLRYRYFEQLRHDIGAEAVCVAHHRDDSAETVLLNLLRGTGIHGLCGIQPKREHIIRPLLCVSRADILSWLQTQQQDYVTDSTNLSDDMLRNHLRLNVIPTMQKKMPAAVEQILCTSHHLAEVARVYDQAIHSALKRLVKDDTIAISLLLQEPSAECILFEWLAPLGFTPTVIEEIANRLSELQPGRVWTSDTHEMTVSDGYLIIRPAGTERPTLRIPEPGTYVCNTGERFRVSMAPEARILTEPHCCCLDAAKVSFPLTLRSVATADRFQPLGMKGSKLVSDYLCDRKVNVLDRRQQLVVTDSSNNILWLVDQRPDQRFRVTQSTQQTLLIEHLQ